MPSVELELGLYVVRMPPRADGTERVFFKVPPRLRPSGWSPTIPLPLTGERTGDLTDADEVARIQKDAAALLAQLYEARGGDTALRHDERSIEALNAHWQASQKFKACRPKTKAGYLHYAKDVLAWANMNPHLDPATLTEIDVEGFLALFDASPTNRYHVRKVGRMILQQAVRLKWRTDNPFDGVAASKPDTQVIIWEQADVDAYVKAALDLDLPDIAGIILTEWEIGQRLTDVILFRRGVEYVPGPGEFQFPQQKTNSKVAIPVSDKLRALLDVERIRGSLYLFHDTDGFPFPDDNRLSKVFKRVRSAVLAAHPDETGADVHPLYRQLRALRHSCVVQLARAGCTVPEIASITGHSLASVQTILETYLPRDSQVARNAQVKRGLIKGQVA